MKSVFKALGMKVSEQEVRHIVHDMDVDGR